jgi:hypothetical protein
MESGAFYDSWTLTTGVDTTESLSKGFAHVLAKLNCPSPGAGGVECLRSKNTTEVFAAGDTRELGGHWVPSIDGVDLPVAGPVLASKGTIAPVPVFAGYVAEDISTMVCCLERCTRAEFESCAASTYSLTKEEAAELSSLYADDVIPPGATGTQWDWAAKHAGADQWAGCPARRIVRWATQAGHEGFYYRWSHTAYNPADGGAPGHAHHALEQPFVFHVLAETPEELKEDGGK